jgi:hypothetical protein
VRLSNNLNNLNSSFIALAAAGWCYQCDSRSARCQIDIDPTALIYDKVPCNGQCYIRVQGGRMLFQNNSSFFMHNIVVMSRGCSWEYGFMQKQLSFTPIFEKEAMWIFCDTAL